MAPVKSADAMCPLHESSSSLSATAFAASIRIPQILSLAMAPKRRSPDQLAAAARGTVEYGDDEGQGAASELTSQGARFQTSQRSRLRSVHAGRLLDNSFSMPQAARRQPLRSRSPRAPAGPRGMSFRHDRVM